MNLFLWAVTHRPLLFYISTCARVCMYVRNQNCLLLWSPGWAQQMGEHTQTHTTLNDCPCGIVECLNTNVATPPGATLQGHWITPYFSVFLWRHTDNNQAATQLYTVATHYAEYFSLFIEYGYDGTFFPLHFKHTLTRIPDGGFQHSQVAHYTVPSCGYHGDTLLRNRAAATQLLA